MAKRIWRFKVNVAPDNEGRQTIPETTVEIPAGFKVLSYSMSPTGLSIYCDVDPEAPKVPVKIRVIPTGDEMPENAQYVGMGPLPVGDSIRICHVMLDATSGLS